MSGFVVDIKKAQDFFQWAVSFFAGQARISFEGKFPDRDFLDMPGAGTLPTVTLRKNTAEPASSFIALPLERQTVGTIAKSVLPRIGLRRRVYHIQIEKGGQLALAAYDNLQYCWLAPMVQESDLVRLKSEGIIRSFTAGAAPEQR
jgi:hypothetical protein